GRRPRAAAGDDPGVPPTALAPGPRDGTGAAARPSPGGWRPAAAYAPRALRGWPRPERGHAALLPGRCPRPAIAGSVGPAHPEAEGHGHLAAPTPARDRPPIRSARRRPVR